jgi:outer membrane protein OmpA-like peptidoglycan-associated protein/tetratricopeptide (TPR) repeat protein
MKKVFIFPILLGCVSAFSQLTLKRADKYFNQLDYEKAAYFYKAFLHDKDDAYSQLQLAKIYSHMNMPVETERWYREVIDREDLEPVHYLHYAQALSSLGKYQEALPYYQKYQAVATDKLLAQEKTYGIQHIEDFFADSAYRKVNLATFNSPASDFAPSFYNGDVVFASGKGNAFGLQRKFAWNNKNFYDLYVSDSTGDIEKFDCKINSKFHEGATTFSADGNTVYFTRNNYNKGRFGRSNKGVNMIKIYSATKDDQGKWGNIQEFKYNSDDYSTGDPALSPDGKTLYFVSDRPGGFGGTDIYKSSWTGTEWSEPVNVGHKVNTESNERTPFLAADNILYFASEGHFGLGGLDIYAAESQGATFTDVRNLGYPVNSSRDDFGFIINSQTRNGYFSSDRAGGKGDDDIYSAYVEENPKVMVTGTSFWRTDESDIYSKKILPFATLTVKNLTTGETSEIETDEQGAFTAPLKQGYKYEIIASKDTLSNSVARIDLTNKAIKKISPIEMTLVQKTPKPKTVKLEGTVIDAATKATVANPTMFLYNTKTKKTQRVNADANGNYSLSLDPNTEYLMKTAAPGYLINCVSFTTPAASKTAQKISSPLELTKLALNQKIEVKNLLYDVNKFNIRPDAALELDKVVQFMKDNAGITVELGAHTDARGSTASNSTLSNNRAKAAHDYIVSKGISDTQISYKGYGESQPLNKCVDGVTCTNDEYSVNRRTEIKITGIKKEVDPSETLTEANAFPAGQSSASCQNVQVIQK